MATKKTGRKKILILERKILRKIFEPVKDSASGKWRKRKSAKLKSLFQSTNIIDEIRKRRLQWAGLAWRSLTVGNLSIIH